MRKWIFIHTVPMYQSTSGLMEQTCVHRNARHIRTKGHLPYVSGHRPWREELRDVLQGEERRTPMLIIQMTQAVTDGALPNRAPFDRAAPQLTQLQMEIDHMHVQCRFNLHFTYGAKPRRTVSKCPVRSMMSTSAEALHFLRPSLASS